MSYRREIPKLNRDNFQAWKELIKLQLETIGDTCLKFLNTKYVSPPDPLTMDQMVENKNHKTMMIGIDFALNYVEFDEVKYCPTTREMWNKLQKIQGRDDNVRRAKAKSLRGQFDQMKMRR